MAGPSWLAGVLAAVMIAIAVYCASRLAISRLWRRETEFDADAVHVVMGVAMAGMLVPRLSPLPDSTWEAVFGTAAAWFAWQAIRTRRRTARDSLAVPPSRAAPGRVRRHALHALPRPDPSLPARECRWPA